MVQTQQRGQPAWTRLAAGQLGKQTPAEQGMQTLSFLFFEMRNMILQEIYSVVEPDCLFSNFFILESKRKKRYSTPHSAFRAAFVWSHAAAWTEGLCCVC